MELINGQQKTPVWVPASLIGGKRNEPDVPGFVLEVKHRYVDGKAKPVAFCKVEVTVSKVGFDNQPIASTFVYKKLVPGDNLKQRAAEKGGQHAAS
jgi:hypothetical protein